MQLWTLSPWTHPGFLFLPFQYYLKTTSPFTQPSWTLMCMSLGKTLPVSLTSGWRSTLMGRAALARANRRRPVSGIAGMASGKTSTSTAREHQWHHSSEGKIWMRDRLAMSLCGRSFPIPGEEVFGKQEETPNRCMKLCTCMYVKKRETECGWILVWFLYSVALLLIQRRHIKSLGFLNQSHIPSCFCLSELNAGYSGFIPKEMAI